MDMQLGRTIVKSTMRQHMSHFILLLRNNSKLIASIIYCGKTCSETKHAFLAYLDLSSLTSFFAVFVHSTKDCRPTVLFYNFHVVPQTYFDSETEY